MAKIKELFNHKRIKALLGSVLVLISLWVLTAFWCTGHVSRIMAGQIVDDYNLERKSSNVFLYIHKAKMCYRGRRMARIRIRTQSPKRDRIEALLETLINASAKT